MYVVVDENLDPVSGTIQIQEWLQGLFDPTPTPGSWTVNPFVDNVGMSTGMMTAFSDLQTFTVDLPAHPLDSDRKRWHFYLSELDGWLRSQVIAGPRVGQNMASGVASEK